MQEYQLEIEEIEQKKERSLQKVYKWFLKNIKFLLIPGSRIEELSRGKLNTRKIGVKENLFED
jgi:hypothetical protein